MPDELLLRNCRPYDAPADAPPVDVLLRDGRIESPDGPPVAPGVATLDAGGRILAPGLIDLHIHGAGGADVLDATPDALRTMSVALARMGTTAFVATSVMLPSAGDRHLDVTAELTGTDLGGARLLGLYLEGPFVNPAKRGGIPESSTWLPRDGRLEEILERTGRALLRMTVAPELPGALDVIRRLREAHVVPAFGHSDATYDETREGIAAGIGQVTHLFNAMRGLHHRDPGPLPALLEAPHLPLEIIGDGVHVERSVVRFAARAFGLERLVCITDAMRTTGLPDGRYRYGEREFDSRDGTARYLDGTLIGTAVPLLEVLRRFRRFTGCSLADAIDAATVRAAAALGLRHPAGTLTPGADADLLLLDPDLSLWKVIVGGRVL